MKRWIYRGWLTVSAVACMAAARAQEPFGGSLEPNVPTTIAMPEAIPFTQWNRPTRIKPMNWEKLLNERVGRERAWEQSLLISGAMNGAKRFEVHGNRATWNFRIGNSPASWSISAGSHLDARTLMFPIPRRMTPNRPTGSRVAPDGQIKR